MQLVYYAYVAGSWLARALPERVAYGLAHLVGTLVAPWSEKKQVVEANIARITGEPAGSPRVRAIARRAFASYARYWLETFRLVKEDKQFFLQRFLVDGVEHLDDVLGRGRGAIIVVGHLGNWDAAGAWLGATGRRLVTVAEELKPTRLFDFFVKHREKLGMRIYPARRGVTARLVEELEGGAVVALLGDRDLRGSGPEVIFFGERATFPGGPASIALRTGIPLLVAGVYSEELEGGRRGWTAEISEPIELPGATGRAAVAKLTQQVADLLEAYVARRPEEWHVFQPFWLADRARS